MGQAKKETTRPRQQKKDEGEERTRSEASVRRKPEELKEKIAALLEKIDAALREHQNDACSENHVPHIHLCDGTKVDLRKLFR